MNARFFTLVAIIIAVALFRYLPHPPNVSPIAAMALFAGASFSDKRAAFLVPFVALFAGDLLIGLHDTMVFVYFAFGLTVLAGFALRNTQRVSILAATVVGTSVVFFLITNLGVWLTSALYPMTLQGLAQAYAAGIPFFQNTLLGNLFFSALLFGGYALLRRRAGWMQAGAVSRGQ
ncbi:MAG: DUF6580 family putative transport protein [Gammaproteobacteria bacterium]